MLEIARSNHRKPDNVELKLNSKTYLSLLASELFDFVLSLIVLQHMPWRYVKAYLSKLVRAAKPGGIIVFRIPTRTVAPFQSWTDKTLRSDDPSIGRLCYRSAMRILRWIPIKVVHAFMTSALWHQVRYLKLRASGQPHMEMNPWEEASLEAFIEKRGAKILQCQKEPEVPESLESYVYFVRKAMR